MKFVLIFLALIAFAGKVVSSASAQESLLTERLLNVALTSAKLSSLAYSNSSEYAILDANGNVTGFEHPDYEEISFFTQEPDAAVIAKSDGRCFLAFRGTSATLSDWEQNIDLRTLDAYKNNDTSTGESCEVRRGYADFVFTDPVYEAYLDLLECTASCSDQDDCVVITGHSQGGASAAVASILTYDLMPTVITFGMPPAAKAGCKLIPSERMYRFVNHRKEEDEVDDLGFDPVPFAPTLFSNSVHYGHYLLVGPDKTAAKYLGFDTNYTFSPSYNDENEIESHTMGGKNYSYTNRIENLLNTGIANGFPVSMSGFAEGIPCEPNYRELCASNSCQNNLCASKVTELCIENSCTEDDDCESGTCIYNACAAGSEGQVEGGCPCRFNGQCKSGDCDHAGIAVDLGGVCEFGPDENVNSSNSSATCDFPALGVNSLVIMMALGTFAWL